MLIGKMPCQDHNGRPFMSENEMCRYYGISVSTFKGRLTRGWTLEQALTIKPDGNGPKVNPRGDLIRDHLGREFISISAMCRAWNISEKVYWSRKRLLKWPLEKILTEPVRDISDAANAIKIQDHTGKDFPSISAMCRHWNIGLSTYRERIKRGWTLEQALTGQETKIQTDPVICLDHLGNRYPSKNAMCRAYGVTRYCYDDRIRSGWTKEQALTQRHVINAKPCRDHTGKQFPSTIHMALYLGLKEYTFQGLAGDASHVIPTQAAKQWHDRDCGAYHIKYCVTFPWFLAVDQDKSEIVLHFDQILDEYHRQPYFRPLPDSKIKDPPVQVIKQIRWPWFLCRIQSETYILHYDTLIQAHVDSNFGLSDAGLQIEKERENKI